MADLSSLRFAIRASECLQSVAHELCADGSCIQFCAILAATLANVVKWLQTLPDDESSKRESGELLDELEGILRSPEGSPGKAENVGERHAALKSLLQDSAPAAQAIRILASDREARRQRKRVLVCLDSYLPETADEDRIQAAPSNADLQASSEAPPECGREIKSLYKTLSAHCFCNQPGETASEVVARIRLRSGVRDGSELSFGVLFLAHPHQDGPDKDSHPLWQDTYISVRRAVNFKATSSGTEHEEIRLDSDTPFCSYISTQDDAGPSLLYLSVAGEKLYYEELQDPKTQWEFDRPSISLGQLLDEVARSADDFSEKRKEVLSWLLAKAVWQYYTSPWMAQPWDKETVHFLFERRQNDRGHEVTGIFVNEPLLSVSISPHASGDETEASTGGGTKTRRPSPFALRHKVPKILGLGITLLEIQLGRSIESLHAEPEWAKYCPRGRPNLNTNFNICKDIIASPNFFEDVSDPLEGLIRKCIEPRDTFVPPRVRDEEGIREALYVLINRLEVYLAIRKPHTVKPLSLPGCFPRSRPVSTSPAPPSPIPPPARLLTPVPRPLSPRNLDVRLGPGRTMAQLTSSTSTEGWFKRMDSFNYILNSGDSHSYDKVRVAVLDTGVSPHDSASVYIAGYKDFVTGNDAVKCDNTGHGTTSVNLVFRMCESADVFALRIFETDQAKEDTRALAVKAIDWCIANKMDVICMACGFQGFDQELFDITHQASGKMLVFAAPTNDSNVGEIAYPARHHDEVFCMFSTNGAINGSDNLNPTERLGRYNFAILGENIQTFDGDERSGTSFSTAIAAGLASRLLDFSRHEGRVDKTHAPMMKVKHGMTKILLTMSISDGVLHCLKPWQLLPENLRAQVPFDESGLPTELERREARDHISTMIRLSLENALRFG